MSIQKMFSDKMASKNLIKASSIKMMILAKTKFSKLDFQSGEDMKLMSSWSPTNYLSGQISAQEF